MSAGSLAVPLSVHQLVLQDCGADCAKFQKSELEYKFNKKALERPYTSKHSWGKTYGEHKRHLEFSHDQYRELKKYAEEIGIFFTASGMDEVCKPYWNDKGSLAVVSVGYYLGVTVFTEKEYTDSQFLN